MEIGYYPGCTLKTSARNFERTALAVLELLGIKAVELSEWYCCGVNFSQVQDNLMLQLAPLRTLMKARDSGFTRLLTLCTMCYNTLRRASLFLQADEERQRIINDFMDRGATSYRGDEVTVIELLTLFKEIGISEIGHKIGRSGIDLKVAPYYGCMLLRPREVAVDDASDPTIMEEVLQSVGCQPVAYPMRIECCGSYQIVNEPAVVRQRTRLIVESAWQNGAEVMVVLCPLCHYNLDAVQLEIQRTDSRFQTMPVLYLTQLLALLAGIGEGNDWSLHSIDPRPILKAKGLL